MSNNSVGGDGKVIPAKMELTVQGSNVIGVNGNSNFEHFDALELGDGANTFVFGNNYWGGGSSIGNNLIQTIPLADMLMRNVQSNFEVNTSLPQKEGNPLILDFRAVNRELYFTFSPISGQKPGEDQAVKLTVRSVQDLELPFVGLGPEWRNQTLVFTHVDKNTKIYGGRYKNTFNFDRGATFQGALVGGEGYGSFLNMPGSNMDKLREAYIWVEDTMGGLSVSDLEGLIYNVENTLSYSNPLNLNNYGTGISWKDFVTTVNYEKLTPPSGTTAATAANKIAQVALGNWAALGIDAVGWQDTTGLSGRIENFGDINLGDIIVRSGINLVRGSDYNPYDTEMGNPLAVFTSGSDTISIGDNYASLTPGVHILAGGSGGDTYKFNSQYWGFSLIVDDFAAPLDLNNISSGNNVGDAILSGLIPRDVLDFSNFYSDLYFTVFEASVEDIAALNEYMPTDNELTNLFNYLNPGASLVMVTTVPLPVPGYSDSDSGEDQIGEFRLSNLLPYLGTAQMALAVGVEDIVGGRGNNLVSFINGAELNGRLEPGFGGNMALDYSRYHGSLKSTGASGGSPEETGWESEVVIGSNPYSDFEVVPSMQDIVNGMGDWLSENVKVTKSEANSEVTYTVTFPERLGDVNELNSDIIGSSQSITHITATEGSNETSEVQTFNLPSGLSASDLFVLTFKDQNSKEETTVSLPGNAEADAVQKALNDLASIQWFTTPEFIDSLLPSVMYTYADATGTKGSLGVGETGDVSGSKFNDSLVGNKNDNKFEGHGGNDLLKGGEGNDTLNGGEGDDKLDGGNGNDNLDGGKGDDKLFGGPGDDTLNPGNGDDLLDGGSGLDSYIPSSNNSLIVFDNAASPLGITHSTTTEFSEGNDEIQTFEVPSWLTGFIGFQLQFTKADSEVETTVSLAYDADATAVQNALNNLSSLTGVTVAKSNKTYTVTFPTTLGNVRELTSKIISLSPEITHSTPTEGDNPVAEVQTFELPSGLGESNQFELIFTGSDSQAETTTSLGYDADATAVQNALNSLSSLTGVTVAKSNKTYTVTFPASLGNVDELTSNFNSLEYDALTGVEIIQIDGSSSLPKRATFITSDSLDPVFLVNPNGLKDLDLETYYFHINSKSRINLKGYESDKIDFGSYDNTGKTQTLTLYSDSAKGEGHRLLTMVVTGHESAISASDINFTRDDLLLAESTGGLAAYYALTQEAIRPLLSEAKSRWLQATGFDPLVAESLENLRVSVADLNGAGLAKTFQNHITVDLNAAGNGWFVDPTPDADEEFSIVPTNELRNADSNSAAYGRYDLLSVLLHEFGHSLGLSHTSEGGQLMSSELRAGTRTVVSDEVISFVSVGYPVTDFQEAAPVSDQTKILDGLDKFATWADGLGNTLGNYVADSTQLPFMKQSISDFWNAAPGKITGEISTQIKEQILDVFDKDSDGVTSEDLLALPVIDPSPTKRLSEFQANIGLLTAGNGLDLQLNLDILSDLGLDLTRFVSLKQSEPLHVEAALDLRFNFGLDSTTGEFFVEDPTLVARITARHENPLNISLSVGPLGIGIEDDSLFPSRHVDSTEGRYAVEDLLIWSLGVSHLIPKAATKSICPSNSRAPWLVWWTKWGASMVRSIGEIPWESVPKI